MKDKPFVYLATSLTHVPENERDDIRKLVAYLREQTNFLQWAFDTDLWKPAPVESVWKFDSALVEYADFLAGVFFSSAGSDGRGCELEKRAIGDDAECMRIYVRKGVKISAYIAHMVRDLGLQNSIYEFLTIEELGRVIVNDAISLQDRVVGADIARGVAVNALTSPTATLNSREAAVLVSRLQSQGFLDEVRETQRRQGRRIELM